MISEVVLSVGSNCGSENVRTACEWLGKILDKPELSGLYQTPAVNGGMRDYVNAVVSGQTDLTVDALNARLKEYELMCGRDENSRRSGIVPVDIDIVIVDGKVIREWDFRQSFFRIGYSELFSPVV